MPEKKSGFRVTTVVLVIALLALFVTPLVMHGLDAEFAGTDGQGTETIEEEGAYKPWFELNIIPQSTELQSGLFAIQAALGAGIFGYALGVMNERRRSRRDSAGYDADTSPTSTVSNEQASQ